LNSEVVDQLLIFNDVLHKIAGITVSPPLEELKSRWPDGVIYSTLVSAQLPSENFILKRLRSPLDLTAVELSPSPDIPNLLPAGAYAEVPSYTYSWSNGHKIGR